MKLVLKRQEEIKLFTEGLAFDPLILFIQREFDVEAKTIEITFIDEDGDSITIASEDDMAIIESYFNGKQYVKLNVKGQKKVKNSSVIDTIQAKKQQGIEVAQAKKKKKKQTKKKQEKIKKEPKSEPKQKKAKKQNEKKCDKKAAGDIKKLLNLVVAELVDERLKAMIPCMKQQLSKPAEEKKVDESIHEDYQCNQCLQSPIIGIRFECPVCEGYNICGICEGSNQHEHNLLKIKHLKPKQAEKGKDHLDQLCKILISKTQKNQKEKAKEQAKEQQAKTQQKEKIKQTKRYLSQLFGNQPKFYHEFVKKNKKLTLQQIIKAYSSASQALSNDELQERIIDLQCERLSKKFSKEANLYKDFVRENFSFDLSTILKLIYQKGIEKKQKNVGKQKPAKEVKIELKEQVRVQKKEEMKEEAKIENKEVEKPQKKEESKQLDKEEQPSWIKNLRAEAIQKAKKQESQLKGGKQQTLNIMIDFFGKEKKDEFIKFIAANQKYSKQDIVQMWADRFSLIS